MLDQRSWPARPRRRRVDKRRRELRARLPADQRENPAPAERTSTPRCAHAVLACAILANWRRPQGPRQAPRASIQARSARTGHVAALAPKGTATTRPLPSWSVFEAPSEMTKPCGPRKDTSEGSRDESSLRRHPSANPTRRRAPFRRSSGSPPETNPQARRRSSGVIAALPRGRSRSDRAAFESKSRTVSSTGLDRPAET